MVAAVAGLAALLVLLLAGPASASRPGFYSNPDLSGTPAVGATLNASDGGLSCEPTCNPGGDAKAGIFFEYVSCPTATSGGSDRPTGGMPDDPRPCPGGVSRGAPTKDATTYVVRPDDAGRYIQVHVHATNLDCSDKKSDGTFDCMYSTGHGYSSTVGPIGGSAAPPPPPVSAKTPPNMTAYPSTSGLAKEGETLSATPGSWTASPTKYAYQWKRCAPEFEPCEEIPGANAATYVLAIEDIGKRVQVLVTASNAYGSNSAASFPSEIVATAAVAPASSALPVIAGTPEDRQTLTVTPGTWAGTAPIEYAYQWLRCSTKLGGCAPIEGATQSTYVVTRDDLVARIAVTVTATNRGGTATATSALTDRVVGAKPRPGADRLAIADLVPQNGLVVAQARAAQGTVRPRGRIAVRVTVKDRRGFLIAGAKVTVTGPRRAIVRGATVTTNAGGFASVTLRAGAKLPMRKLVLTITVASTEDATLEATKRIAVRTAVRKAVRKKK